jgi:chromosome partitioning protein
MNDTPTTGPRPVYHATVADLAALTGESIETATSFFEPGHLLPMGGGRSGVTPKGSRAYLSAKKIVDYDFRVIATINLRGGIGKTTASVTAATRAVQYGFTACLLDLDSQGSASVAFDAIPDEEDPIFLDIWEKPTEMTPHAAVKIEENLWLIPSALENGLLDSHLTRPAWQKTAVRGVCDALRDEGADLVFVDCPPSLGAGVISAICAADLIVIPVGSDPFSIRGLELTLNEIGEIRGAFGLPEATVKILYSRFDRREKMSFDTLELLQTAYADRLIPTPIRTSTHYSKALAVRQTVFASHTKSVARDDYDQFVRALLNIRPANGKNGKKGGADGSEKGE